MLRSKRSASWWRWLFGFLNLRRIRQTTAADVSKKTGEAWDTIKAYGSDKQKEAVTHGKQLMKDADAKIAQLETSPPRPPAMRRPSTRKRSRR